MYSKTELENDITARNALSSKMHLTDIDYTLEKAIEYHQSGQLQQAEEIYRKILEIDPLNESAYYNMAVALNRQGKTKEAIDCYLKVIELNPEDADAYYNIGAALSDQGKTKEAIKFYQKAVELNSIDIQAYNNMGIAYRDLGNTDEAITCYRKALEIDPNYLQTYNNLGILLRDQDKFSEAIDCYRKVLELKSDDAQAYNNMGIVYKDLGNTDEALICFSKALEISPAFFQAYNNMGNVYKVTGNTEEALLCFHKALEISPGFFQACNNIGIVLQDQGKLDEAILWYSKALTVDPVQPEVYCNMGNALKEKERIDEAISYYKKALEIDPGMSETCKIIGTLLNDQGKTKESVSYYQKALRIRQDPGLEIRSSIMLPVICESRQSIELSRERILENIENLSKKKIRIKDPLNEVGTVNFLLTYHGLNDKEIQERIASFHINACPELAWTSPHCNKPQRMGSKIKIGIISTFLYGHTIGQLFYGIIKNLSRETFHVKIFRFPGNEDPLSQAIDMAADEVIALPYELATARQMIAEHPLDILFYLDIGMDPMTYFLAFSRLAPVQCTTWGHPDTTGIPNIDYFISSKTAEPPGAEKHYSEQLILLERLGTYFYPPQAPQFSSRDRFALPKNRTLYVCPQSLFKFHPDFDDALLSILKQDPNGLLVLLEGRDKHWSKLLYDRFSRTLGKSVDRIRFLPRMSHNDFLSLFPMADAVLDTTIFSGGKSSLDCFASGTPIVTLPSQFLCGRLTLAQYKQMGIMDCVAKDSRNFADIALRLANDKVWKEEVAHKIRAKANILFRDTAVLNELEDFFYQAVRKTHDA